MSHTYKQKKNRLKGFTLIELIVVVAIIGILLGLFIPTISGYMRRSRLKSSNANAKLVFNSIQTICQELEFSERGDDFTTFYGSESVERNEKTVDVGITNGAMIVRSDGGVATAQVWLDNDDDGTVDAPADAAHVSALIATLNDDSTRSSFMNRMDRLFAGNPDTVWVAYISGYQVQAVICADSASTNYVGAYPINTTETFNRVMDDLNMNDVDDIDSLMSRSSAFTDVRDCFVTPAWPTETGN